MKKFKVQKEKKEFKKGPMDKSIFTFAVLFTIFGLVMIYNASAYLAQQEFNDQFYFLKLQTIWVVGSSIIATIVYFIDYHRISKIIVLVLIANIILLILVLIFGQEINGAKRWFDIAGIAIQPSEFIKPIIIIYLATWLAKYRENKDQPDANSWNKTLGYVGIITIVAGLIIAQPDMGTISVIIATSFLMFFLFIDNKTQIQHILKIGLVTIIAGIGFIVLSPYRLSRVVTFVKLIVTGEVADPRGAGYQIHQLLIGIGSSGFWGKGFGQSRQRFGYLVENTAFTDSTFAVVLEEFGFVSALVIIALWLFFFFKGKQIAENAPDTLGKAIAIGIIILLTLQALLNIAANIGIIPITGLPFPFLTYGGSSTLVTFICIAILLNISQYKKNDEEDERVIRFK